MIKINEDSILKLVVCYKKLNWDVIYQEEVKPSWKNWWTGSPAGFYYSLCVFEPRLFTEDLVQNHLYIEGKNMYYKPFIKFYLKGDVNNPITKFFETQDELDYWLSTNLRSITWVEIAN